MLSGSRSPTRSYDVHLNLSDFYSKFRSLRYPFEIIDHELMTSDQASFPPIIASTQLCSSQSPFDLFFVGGFALIYLYLGEYHDILCLMFICSLFVCSLFAS